MANNFLNPVTIVSGALGVLEREVVLPQLVWRDAEAGFDGAKGDTVTLRLPAYLEAHEFDRSTGEPIVVDDLNEIGVPVTLDKELYSAVAVTDPQLTLGITDFTEQVTQPQSRAVVRGLEQTVAVALDAAPVAWTVDESDPWDAAVEARKALNKAAVPMAGRVLLVGADVEAVILKHPLFVRADQSGSDNALREANPGRIAGFQVVVSQYVDAALAWGFHRSAFALANRAPVVPEGATFGESMTFESYAMRWLRDYDANYLRDRAVMSSLAGCSSVNDGVQLDASLEDKNVRCVKLTGVSGGSSRGRRRGGGSGGDSGGEG